MITGSNTLTLRNLSIPRAGNYQIALCAYGTPVNGVSPQANILIDGKNAWGTATMTANLTAGTHVVSVTFDNFADTTSPASFLGTRRLVVQNVTFTPN